MKGKTYNKEEIESKFKKGKCLECDNGKVERNGSSPNGGWVDYYRCDSCKTRYEFQDNGMGETFASLESNA